jgi:hypothetical protein
MAFSTLTREQRGLLSRAVTMARREAEQGAREALSALAVDHHEPYAHMTSELRSLRNALRAHGRQLGDARDPKRGTQGIERLAHEVAFEHWHRMLFARFLAENGLLIHPAHGVAVSIAECIDLAKDEGQDPWVLAASFGQEMLPQIFRQDDPALSVALPANRRMQIEKLLGDLPAGVFLASDALGWTYQYWQSEKKAAVNARGEAIGADDIAAVTQLFTEHYMVEFLLHNTLGAWHAGKVLSGNPGLLQSAVCEEELRAAVAIDGCDWPYLRFVRSNAGREDDESASPEAPGPWVVAAGTYPSWPSIAREITILDPCLGSGHIFVTAFELLVALRRHEEGLSLRDAIPAVLAENMFGLELDPRCTQIGVFAVALHAWKMLGGRCPLPKVQIACSGLSVGGTKEAWVRHAGGNGALARGMADLYDLFEQAPLLGSLIDPDRMLKADLLTAGFDEIAPVVEQAMAASGDEATHEAGIAAAGMVEAVRLLRGRYTLVVTNPPYLGRGKQARALTAYADAYERDARQEISTMFVSRALRWCGATGSVAMVLPQNWLFLTSYRKFREHLLKAHQWNVVARLGNNAFQDMNWWAATTTLLVISGDTAPNGHLMVGVDVSSNKRQLVKAALLRGERSLTPDADELSDAEDMPYPEEVAHTADGSVDGSVNLLLQARQLKNPDARVVLAFGSDMPLLLHHAVSFQGICTGDYPRFGRAFWENADTSSGWVLQQSASETTKFYSGLEQSLLWEGGNGQLYDTLLARLGEKGLGSWIRGTEAWGRNAVAIRQIGALPASIYTGQSFDTTVAVILPKNDEHPRRPPKLPHLWPPQTPPPELT